LLTRFIANSCEARIPRSGHRGAAVNCYVVAVHREGFPYFIATSIADDRVDGLQWNGGSYSDHTTLSIADLDAGNLHITHYFGLSEVTYDSIYDAAWNYVTKLAYLRIKAHVYIDSTFQFFFNKRKLVTKKRIELLQLMMDDQIDRTHNGITLSGLMEKIYSMRMFLHPSWETQERKVQLYLDSLVSSGEVNHINNEYVVTGVALNTIERYEEDERRHAEAVKMQWLIALITVVGVAFTAVQSGFVKLPTVLDLSKPANPKVSEKCASVARDRSPFVVENFKPIRCDQPVFDGKKKS
jgi:hypothetical protein